MAITFEESTGIPNVFEMGNRPTITNPTNSGGIITNPTNSGSSGGGINNPIKYDDLMSFINALIDIIIQIGTPILVLAIVYVGFLFVQASGKPEKLNEAKQALVYTLIGAAIVLGAFIISGAIQGTVDSLK